MSETSTQFSPGQAVRITQRIPQRDGAIWTTDTEGTIVKFEQKKTGSWYAHAKDEKLWLDRLTIRKADGEITVLSLDQYTQVELV